MYNIYGTILAGPDAGSDKLLSSHTQSGDADLQKTRFEATGQFSDLEIIEEE